MRLWNCAAAAAAAAAMVGLPAAAAQAAAPPNGGPVTVFGAASPLHGHVGTGSGRVGTVFALTPVRGGCPHQTDTPFVQWKSPYTSETLVTTPGNRTGYMPTGAPGPLVAAAKPRTYSAQLECLAISTDHLHTSVDKVFTPASITLTGRQLRPALSRTTVAAGGSLTVTLPAACGSATKLDGFVYLVSPDGRFITGLAAGSTTIPSSVDAGHYFVTGQCDTNSAPYPGYGYGFAPVTVTR
jgi:hypothetical protein